MTPALPIMGPEIRFGPADQDCQLAATPWKVWAHKSEVYASTRTPGGMTKFSVHESGQIHLGMGPKSKKIFASLMEFPGPGWHHAFELRFLLSEAAKAPLFDQESPKRNRDYLIQAPPESVVIVNLILCAAEATNGGALPPEYGGAEILWRKVLCNKRHAILISRVLPMDDANRKQLRYLTDELNVRVGMTSDPIGPAYVELHNYQHSPEGGNIFFIVPLGENAIRSQSEWDPQEGLPTRSFHYHCAASTMDIAAPDLQTIATIGLGECDQDLSLAQNRIVTADVGLVTLRLDPSALVAGSPFIAAPGTMRANPMIDGGSPRTWDYEIVSRFDGSIFTAELRTISASLQNRNMPTPILQLGDQEELLLTIPKETVVLTATMECPTASVRLNGTFGLFDLQPYRPAH